MREHFAGVFRYSRWANRRLLSALARQEIHDPGLLGILAHAFLAERIWLERIKGESSSSAPWRDLSLSECEALEEENASALQALLDDLSGSDLGSPITYKNSKGIEFSNTIGAALTHLALHSAYHRGQVAHEMRRLGKEPVNTDYITFVREEAG